MYVLFHDAVCNTADKSYCAKDNEAVFYLVAFESPMLELEGKHRNLGYKEP